MTSNLNMVSLSRWIDWVHRTSKFLKMLNNLKANNCPFSWVSTQANFQVNTTRYKGRDSTAGIGRKLSIKDHHSSWNNYRCCSLPGRSMTTKWQTNPTSRVSVTASQAGENSQTNGPEHTMVLSILTDLIFIGKTEEEQYCRTHH